MNVDPALVKVLGEFGVPTVLVGVMLAFAVIFTPKVLTWFTAEQKRRDDLVQSMQDRMVVVVENNTKVVSQLCASTAETAQTLDEHDQRAQRIEQTVGQISRVVDRTEQKVDALATRGKQ